MENGHVVIDCVDEQYGQPFLLVDVNNVHKSRVEALAQGNNSNASDTKLANFAASDAEVSNFAAAPSLGDDIYAQYLQNSPDVDDSGNGTAKLGRRSRRGAPSQFHHDGGIAERSDSSSDGTIYSIELQDYQFTGIVDEERANSVAARCDKKHAKKIGIAIGVLGLAASAGSWIYSAVYNKLHESKGGTKPEAACSAALDTPQKDRDGKEIPQVCVSYASGEPMFVEKDIVEKLISNSLSGCKDKSCQRSYVSRTYSDVLTCPWWKFWCREGYSSQFYEQMNNICVSDRASGCTMSLKCTPTDLTGAAPPK